jgi:hypothetical protein
MSKKNEKDCGPVKYHMMFSGVQLEFEDKHCTQTQNSIMFMHTVIHNMSA